MVSLKKLIKMKIIFFLLYTSFFSISLSAQSPSKKEVSKAFKSWKYYNSRDWTTCNKNEKFFKSDTLSFYDIQGERCDEFVIWTFKSKKSFYEIRGKTTNGVSITYVAKPTDLYKIKVIEKDGKTIIQLYNQNKFVKAFIVEQLINRFQGGPGNILKLVRVK